LIIFYLKEKDTDVTLSSSSDSTSDATSSDSSGTSGMKIQSSDEVIFWHELDLELQRVLNRPEDVYKAEAPIINKNAGIITVTATLKQIKRLEKYLETLQNKVQLQVLIDVQLLSVSMSDGKTTGVDWSQLFKLQNIALSAQKLIQKGVTDFTDTDIIDATIGHSDTTDNNFITMKADGTLSEVIKFLKTQGDVTSISNPKVLTLNNQPALVTSGTEYFYKISTTGIAAGSTLDTTTTSDEIKSVFAGVLLDITPEISDDDTITLKINPSLSEPASTIVAGGATDRTTPPDLLRRQLSSVVTVKDGNRIILGGLITTSNSVDIKKVPLLGDIPLLSYLFSHEKKIKTVTELVIVITPYIIHKDKTDLSLSDLGYTGLSEDLLLGSKKLKMKEENEQ
jgi:general secretion pathway protein D